MSDFVDYVIQHCKNDKGFAARARRADNPATAYQTWDLLVSFNINLESDMLRLPYQIILASIARGKIQRNGSVRLGHAILECYREKNKKFDQAKMRLRRLLACDDLEEVCRVLPTQIRFINSEVVQALDYKHLLDQLILFSGDNQHIKAQWAQEFYSHIGKEDFA